MKQKILFLFLFLFAAQIILPAAVFAETGKNINFNPEVLIPGMEKNASGTAETIKVDGGGEAIRKYISNFYKFAIGLTGILATIMFAIGGLIWLTSGGSATQVGKAKQLILGSLTGLVLALCSYMILNTINPNIVNLHWGKSISSLDNIGVGCAWVDRACKIDTYERDSPGSCGADPKAKPKNSKEWHCCCAKNSDPKTVAGKMCIDKLSASAKIIYEASDLNDVTELLKGLDKKKCEEECADKKGMRAYESISYNKDGSSIGGTALDDYWFVCCDCVQDFIDSGNVSCKANPQVCNFISAEANIQYTCWENDYFCRPCILGGSKHKCSNDYECCSPSGKGHGDCSITIKGYRCK